MAIRCGFFNSISGDRLYNADDMNEPYKLLISNGVFATPQGTPSSFLQVVADSGLNIIVNKGRALFADKWFVLDAAMTLTIEKNTEVLPRIDSVVAWVNTSNRNAGISVLKGSVGSKPTVPPINTNAANKEYRLANVYVGASVSTVTQDDITDTRASGDCGWVTSLIKQVDTSTLFKQWQAAYEKFYESSNTNFNTWFYNVQSSVKSTTIVQSLESTHTTTKENELIIPINIPEYNQALDILSVYMNGVKLLLGTEFTQEQNNSQNITLKKTVDVGVRIDFMVLKSVDTAEAESVITQIDEFKDYLRGTEWTEIATQHGYSRLKYKKAGNTVFLQGEISGINTIGDIVATLPDGFTPNINQSFLCAVYLNDKMNYEIWDIDTRGNIIMRNINHSPLAINDIYKICFQFPLE